MELVWLEDFIALAESGSFIRAAEARHVTQPAFSRRIRSLEHWVGAPLFIRTPQGTSLTEAGKFILDDAQDTIGRLYRLREDALQASGTVIKHLGIAATHSLSFTFFPRWIRQLGRKAPIEAIQLHSDSMPRCEGMLANGHVQFLLSHRHVKVPPRLPTDAYISKRIGEDSLIPLVASNVSLPKDLSQLPYLAYSEESGLGRFVAHQFANRNDYTKLTPLFRSHLAAVLMSMALEGKGIAWLPRSLTEHEIASGHLVRALDNSWDIPLEIHLTRPTEHISAFAEEFWRQLP
ncbi:LysR family transcriptional regulator [Ectopseudomonas oleovorans]|uniref:LysR family transcriptional regulator n=1 Tax=Ectopseudomonas oleovorans TaxID=301 RepID=A0A3D9E7D1_ECTOL|nr:LysR substrate-binding domain-containing protein [Pseudomonas oleovorans]REC98992.1 LysR family transcriptional regulator [Pseudomonas oleovorans]